MTVNELIELLESMPPDADVFVGDINNIDFMTSDEANFKYIRQFEDDGFPAGVYVFFNTEDEIISGLEDLGAVE